MHFWTETITREAWYNYIIKQDKPIYFFEWFDKNKYLKIFIIKSYRNVKDEEIKVIHPPFKSAK